MSGVLPIFGRPELFDIAARCTSFSAMAEEFFATQTAISKRIRQIEAPMGMPCSCTPEV